MVGVRGYRRRGRVVLSVGKQRELRCSRDKNCWFVISRSDGRRKSRSCHVQLAVWDGSSARLLADY